MSTIAERFSNPSTASDEEVRAAALDWINALRVEYGLKALEELPLGRRSDSSHCVLARAAAGLGDQSCGYLHIPGQRGSWTLYGVSLPPGANFSHQGRIINRPITPLVEEFLWRFDAGRYPDLVEALPVA